MTEAEWLTSQEPGRMVWFLGDRFSRRKQRLYAVACVDPFYRMREPGRFNDALTAAELLADGLLTEEERQQELILFEARIDHEQDDWDRDLIGAISELLNETVDVGVVGDCICRWLSFPDLGEDFVSAQSRRVSNRHVVVLREIVGNPFWPVTFAPSWRTANVLALARTAYDDRAWDTLPVLADALADAGCDDATLLDHLRGPGPHVRGCWALDVVLDKA